MVASSRLGDGRGSQVVPVRTPTHEKGKRVFAMSLASLVIDLEHAFLCANANACIPAFCSRLHLNDMESRYPPHTPDFRAHPPLAPVFRVAIPLLLLLPNNPSRNG